MHDPEVQHEWVGFDFGATALGSSFHRDWSDYADDALDHIARRYGSEGDPTPLLLLVEDLLRLRDSGLGGEEIALLWEATDMSLGAPGIPGKEREWLEEVLSFVVPVARSRGASASSCSVFPACAPDGTSPTAIEHRRLAADVVELAGTLDQPRAWSHVPPAAMRGALVRCAGEVCAELAFRFLLHAAHGYWSRLAPETYDRLERLGTAFGHGPHVVDAIRHLVD